MGEWIGMINQNPNQWNSEVGSVVLLPSKTAPGVIFMASLCFGMPNQHLKFDPWNAKYTPDKISIHWRLAVTAYSKVTKDSC